MRKLTLKRLKFDCDQLWRSIILYRMPNCLICHKPAEQAHHLLTKQKWGHLRWDLNNGIPLCSKHHYLLHLDPFIPHLEIHARMGPEWIGMLLKAAKRKRKPYSRKEIISIRTALAVVATEHNESQTPSADGAND